METTKINDNRKILIEAIIKLHNYSTKKHYEMFSGLSQPEFWNLEQFELKPDRFYIAEILSTVESDDYENKTFYPNVELRYHLRSQERKAYGAQHDYFYKGYKRTMSFTYDQINDVDAAIENINAEYEKHKQSILAIKNK